MARTLIYRKGDETYVVSEIKTDQFWRIAPLPVFVIQSRADAAQLGEAAIRSLQHYRESAPHPKDLSDENDPALHALKLKTWDELSSLHAKLVYVEQEGEAVTVIPTLGDEDGGYTPEPTRSKGVRADAREVGEAILAVLNEG